MIATNTYSKRRIISEFAIPNTKFLVTKLENELLVQMIKSKNEKGFTILYNKYCNALYSVLIKMVKQTAIADDLLQDTFVKIWKYIDGFDATKGTLYTWMLNIAKNQAIDYLRSSYYKNQSLNTDLDLFSNTKYAIDSSNVINTELEFKDFKTKALQLNPKYADVINLIFFYGWTQEQTALKLNLPLGTIKTRARKGINMLKILYEH